MPDPRSDALPVVRANGATRYRVHTAVQQFDGHQGSRTGFTGVPITADPT